jgi:hypothetical protein
MMTTATSNVSVSSQKGIPLLDASNLPSADDWAILEAIQADADFALDTEPDFDRFGRFRLSASFEE